MRGSDFLRRLGLSACVDPEGVGVFNDFYKDKVAVVTGAGSGIGQSIARLLDRCGARVHCADINAEAAASLAAELRNAQAHVLDVSDALAVRALADKVFAEDGRVDLLFNNAGIGHAALVLDTELEDWRRVLEVNLMGVVNGVHAFLPRMLKQSTVSHIVNTASGAGLFPHPKMAPYSASKHAVVGLSTSLSAELQGSQVRVTILCPGVVNTAIAKNTQMRGETKARQAQTIDYYKKNGATPDKVAMDLLSDVRKAKLFCLTPRMQVGIGWLVYRWSPRLSIRLMRAEVDRILGVR
jgi:NAD(P)-dependent dehydrogenase (short-subunit alcohol dehydrogenase family)